VACAIISAMNITAPCVVSLVWRLEDAQGQLIDELKDPVEFFYGGDDLLEKVEEALAGQEAGFEAQLHLEPEHAFGEYQPELVFFEERSIFPEGVEPGMQFDGVPEGATTQDMPADAIYTVTEVYDTHVVLDGNHPLAGLALRLALKVRDVREATEEEIAAGSVGEPVIAVMNSAPPDEQIH
jgi:FKBP-type peptidyl-prolyl cis-trans isomerase SlyD